MKSVRNFFIFFVIVCFLGVIFLKKQVAGSGPLAETVTVDISRGISSQKVAEILYDKGVISQPLIFRLLMKYKQNDGQIKAGEYLFAPQVSMLQVLDKLVRGEVVYHKITIPEGYTVGQVLYLLNMNDLLSGEFDIFPDEGAFLPETYTFQKGESRNRLVQEAMAAMTKKLQEVWDSRDEGLPYKDIRDLLIMASIIEKETGVRSERSQVASVFVNRLRKGMLLQTDPTVIYALTEGREELGRPLTRKDLSVDSPYNTYKYAGLPPSPICNPGEASLYAAAHPAETDFLYFVASGNGGHNFAKTLSEHNLNVTNWKKSR